MATVPVHDYVATRDELTKWLVQTLTPIIYARFNDFYQDSARYAQRARRRVSTQQVWEAFLKAVPQWNGSSIEHEEKYIKERLPKIYGVYKGLWFAIIKVISSVRLGAPTELQVTMKPFRDFVHQVYKEVAGELESEPSLFDPAATIEIKRQHRRTVVAIIAESIPDAFRNLLPVDEIYEQLEDDVHGKRSFEPEETHSLDNPEREKTSDDREQEKTSNDGERDPLEKIREQADKLKEQYPEPDHDSPKPSYGSPPRTPEGFISDDYVDDDDPDQDPYLKDLPKDYDAASRPEPEDDYPDSEDER